VNQQLDKFVVWESRTPTGGEPLIIRLWWFEIYSYLVSLRLRGLFLFASFLLGSSFAWQCEPKDWNSSVPQKSSSRLALPNNWALSGTTGVAGVTGGGWGVWPLPPLPFPFPRPLPVSPRTLVVPLPLPEAGDTTNGGERVVGVLLPVFLLSNNLPTSSETRTLWGPRRSYTTQW
jgi:hypothetical protein